MTTSSRTPEGDANRCPVCGHDLRIDPSRPPGDAPCPSCGSLLWFPAPQAEPGERDRYREEDKSGLAWFPPPDERVHMYGELVLRGGGEPIPLAHRHLTVGRRETCDICLRFPNISARHCELDFMDGYWHVRDLNSTNGVKVNGVKVLETVVRPGDTISVGRKEFTIEYLPPTGDPTFGLGGDRW